jgi:hypothetical protein
VNHRVRALGRAALFLLSLSGDVVGQTPPRLYRDAGYGSQAMFSPASAFVNEGFSILQLSNRSNRVGDIRFRRGWRSVSTSVRHPFRTIDGYGRARFVRDEVLPTDLNPGHAQYVPNYALHLLGGGATWRALSDWYELRGYPHPDCWAAATCASYHLMNEVAEADWRDGPSVDPVADLLLFNPLGILLFQSDRVTRWFGKSLRWSDWSFMPVYDPTTGSLDNVGQNFVVRWQPRWAQPWGLLYHFGMHGMLGVSYQAASAASYALAAGVRAEDLVDVGPEQGGQAQTTTLVWTAGAFYDRGGSLMASLITSGTKGYRVRMNLYPGVVRYRAVAPGLFAALRADDQVVLGLCATFSPVGVAHSQ